MFTYRSFLVIVLVVVALSGFTSARGQNSKENADFKLAVNLYNDGLFDLAAEQLKQFIATYPNTTQGIDARFTLGLTQLKLKRYDDARLTFQTFALTYQDNPRAPDAWWNVGESYAAIRNYKEAALAFERVKVFHPKSRNAAEALLKATKYFSLAGERENARKSLRVILQEYPSSSAVLTARTELGQMYFEEGNLEQAQNELKRVIDSDPSPDARASALLILGNIAQATGHLDHAQARYQEIIAKYRSSSAVQGARVNLGKLLAAAGNHEEALENFRKAQAEKVSPDSSLLREALIGAADAHAAMNNHSAAVSSYEQFLAAAPQDARAYEVLWKLATASAHVKNYRKSNDVCARLLKSDAADLFKRRARIRLALNAQEQRNIPLALQQFESFVDSYPDDQVTPDMLMRIGDLAAGELHDYRKAASAYESCPTRYPSAPAADDALAGAARCHEKLKEYDRALQLYNELLTRYPASDLRREAEQRITIIETFEAKESDAGVEKLALLIGDMMSAKDRSALAYRLGEIYFSDLKNYSAAAAQFTTALEGGLPPQQAAEAAFMKARSLEYLSWTDTAVAPRAAEAYRGFLAGASSSPHADDASLALFQLTATSLTAARQAAVPLLTADPRFPHKDLVQMKLGYYLEQADSLPPATAAYADAARLSRDPGILEECAYRRFALLLKQGLVDSALTDGIHIAAAYPRGRYTAEVLARTADMALPKDPHRAVDLYQRLATDFPYTRAAMRIRRPMADALAEAGETDAALAAYTDLYQRAVNDPMTDGQPEPTLLLALGRAHQSAGAMNDAKRFFTAVVSRERSGPVAGEAYTALGLIARTEGARDAATSYFRQAEAAAPGASVTRDIADLLFDNGDYADAIRQYTALSQAAASDSDRQWFDGRIIVARLRSDEAARAESEIAAFVKKYRETGNDLALFELEKGNYYFRKEDYVRAMKSFQYVTDKFDESPSGPTAMYWIGKTLEATERPSEAIQHLEKVLTASPNVPIIPRVHLTLGNLYYATEKWNEAIKNYRSIVDDPKADPALLPSAMSNLIETYEAAGASDGALSLTRKYLELYPNAEDALDKKIKIGILYDKLGYYDQAVLHLQSLLDEAGSDLEGEIRYYIAEANFNKGDFQQAILDFLKVPYLVTKRGKVDWTANSLYMSGQAYEKMGRYDQALIMYQQIVDRTGIDETFKSAARKEIDRVKTVLKRKSN